MLLEHKHLIVRAEIHHPPCNPSAMDDWMRQLVQDIRMKVLMGPFSVYSDMPGNQGLTSVTIIETSHIDRLRASQLCFVFSGRPVVATFAPATQWG